MTLPHEPPHRSVTRGITDLSFTDLYIRLDPPGAAFFLPKRAAGGPPPSPRALPPQLVPEAEALRKLVAADRSADGAIIHNNTRMRVRRETMIGDERWACLRPIASRAWAIGELGIEAAALQEMVNLGRRNGLILIVGATGEGKTTTAVSLLNHWLDTEGGLGYAIEDPVEYDLRKTRANGAYCFQREIADDRDWAEGLRGALRFHPRYIFLGEVRTAAAAGQLLRAASSGHTCLATIHGGSIRDGLEGLLQLAEGDDGGSAARQRLAGCLVSTIHQVMTHAAKPHVNLLVTDENSEGCPFRGCIRRGDLPGLGTFLDALEIRIFGRRRLLDAGGRPNPADGLEPLRQRAFAAARRPGIEPPIVSGRG